MLLDSSPSNVSDSKSILGFETEGTETWKTWDRFLTINGKKAFHIGNICGTCSFFFERLEGANSSVNAKDVIDRLNGGVLKLDPNIIQSLELIIPSGKYTILLQRVRPKLVQPGEIHDYFKEEQVELWGIDGFWGRPHFPKTEYYRLLTTALKDGRGLFEFLIPIFPHTWLQADQIALYKERMNQDIEPTAISISVLDVKSPANYDDDQHLTSHWCLAHYLLDGYHKTYTAAINNKPLTLISFLSHEQGISSQEEIAELITILRKV